MENGHLEITRAIRYLGIERVEETLVKRWVVASYIYVSDSQSTIYASN